ncbi:hypothetical protein PoB_007442800 [Plakobranchus ocellatus]|uniref:Uncharacterized protein n=1 Tax=Plakobranchus ocellatus TaxID=259542 RepID=A0AAV4DU94_9GAST|nr:hypothetical protein PoB_007442800 [Plakobranchus ocellatus]
MEEAKLKPRERWHARVPIVGHTFVFHLRSAIDFVTGLALIALLKMFPFLPSPYPPHTFYPGKSTHAHLSASPCVAHLPTLALDCCRGSEPAKLLCES